MAQKLAGVESEKEKMERMRELFQRKAQMAEKSKLEKMSSVNSKIQSAFKDSNLPVRIDRESGELSLIFKDGYFDFGDHKIKTGMIEVLKQVVPTYAKAIYEDQAISDSIDNIEIIGYASPVFQGKYVNPTKLDPQNFWGLNVNMDLSYRRARSIYRVIFNSLKFKYPYQENFFQQAKVSGRSYLDGRVPSSDDLKLDRKEYCKKYDCDSQHKVVIRYTLKD